jgi:rod shape-determining protein MreD
MKILKLLLFLLIVYLLQTVVVSRFPIMGTRADLMLIVTALLAVNYGIEDGFVAGVLCGFIQDIFGGMFYIHTASKGILGFLVGTFKESVLGTEESVTLTAVLAATVTNYLLELAILFFFFGKPLASVPVLLLMLLISCIYNGILSVVLYPAVKWAAKMIYA